MLSVHTELSGMRTRTLRNERRDRGVRDQMIAMLALGIVVGLVVAIVVMQLAGSQASRARPHHAKKKTVDAAASR